MPLWCGDTYIHSWIIGINKGFSLMHWKYIIHRDADKPPVTHHIPYSDVVTFKIISFEIFLGFFCLHITVVLIMAKVNWLICSLHLARPMDGSVIGVALILRCREIDITAVRVIQLYHHRQLICCLAGSVTDIVKVMGCIQNVYEPYGWTKYPAQFQYDTN